MKKLLTLTFLILFLCSKGQNNDSCSHIKQNVSYYVIKKGLRVDTCKVCGHRYKNDFIIVVDTAALLKDGWTLPHKTSHK